VGRASAFSFAFCLRKSPGGFRGFFCALWAFFEGVLGKVVGSCGAFCGEVVVKCVANAVRKRRFAGGLEAGQGFQVYFFV
jgi:hypothetical protein